MNPVIPNYFLTVGVRIGQDDLLSFPIPPNGLPSFHEVVPCCIVTSTGVSDLQAGFRTKLQPLTSLVYFRYQYRLFR
jgi:hypothetical protein